MAIQPAGVMADSLFTRSRSARCRREKILRGPGVRKLHDTPRHQEATLHLLLIEQLLDLLKKKLQPGQLCSPKVERLMFLYTKV